jgi:hypothetical protein
MTAERLVRLEALPGWVWDVEEANWETGYAVLKVYAEEHGDARPASRFKTPDGYPLGQWVSKQRRRKFTMTTERRERLEALPAWVWGARK